MSPPLADFQPPFEGVLDQLGPFHVAGRAVADVNDVLPDGAMAELVVEGRNAHDRRRRDVGQPADALDRLARHVAVVRLDRLEDRNHGILAAAEPGDALVDEGEIEFRHCLLLLRNRKRLFADAKHVLFSAQIDSSVLERGTGDALFAQVALADAAALVAAGLDDPRLAASWR